MRIQLSCCLLALLAAANADAQFVQFPLPIAVPPSAANSLTPKNNIPVTAFVPQSITFRWRHGALNATGPQPGPANYFIVCVYDTAAGENCDTTPLRWVRATTALARTPVTNPYAPPPQIVVTYDYSLDPQTLDASRQDKALSWKVLACTNMAISTCTGSAVTPLRLSTKNLRAENISTGGSDSTRTRLSATPIVSNTGTTASGTFNGTLEVWEVFYDAAARTCRTDLNWANLPANAEVITAAGQIKPAADFRRSDGTFNSSTVRGIFTASMADDDKNFTAALAPGQTMEVSDALGESANLPHDPNSPTDRAAWVMVLKVDTSDSVKESDEVDNLRIECKHF